MLSNQQYLTFSFAFFDTEEFYVTVSVISLCSPVARRILGVRFAAELGRVSGQHDRHRARSTL